MTRNNINKMNAITALCENVSAFILDSEAIYGNIKLTTFICIGEKYG